MPLDGWLPQILPQAGRTYAGGMSSEDGRPRTPYGETTPPPKPAWLQTPWEAAADRTPLERLRHCWVRVDEHGRVPALLLEWRRTPTGWEGRVVRPVLDLEDEKWRPREEWLPAEQLEEPAGARFTGP